MKTYIFLNDAIRWMGGGQMYIRNKMLDLESRGWHVEVFFFHDGEIFIPELKKFANNRIPDLGLPIFALSQKKIDNVLNIIAAKVKDYDEVLVESSTFIHRHWGELIAQRLKGLNLLFFINENYPKLSVREEDYLLWKQERGEYLSWINIKEKVSHRVASKHNKEYAFRLTSYNNVISYQDYKLDFDSSLPVITSIGRLEKNYILPMVKEVVRFVEENQIKVNFFFIGGAPEEYILNNIKHELSKTNNITPYFFGYVFPIPINLIQTTNVLIATAGSVLVGASNGIPTISIEANDNQPLGIFGHTTNSRLFRTTEPIIPLSSWLKDIIIDRKYKDPINYIDNETNIINEYNSKVIDLIRNNTKEYYDVKAIYSTKEKLYYYIKNWIRRIVGNDIVSRIKSIRIIKIHT